MESDMKPKARTAGVSLAAATAVVFVGFSSTAAYAQVNRGDLEGKGYKCAVVATDFWECTKAGAPTYWCDKTGYEIKPFRTKVTKSQLESQGYKSAIVATDWWVLTGPATQTYWCSSAWCSPTP
jgi:hypothetical protein